MSDRQPARTRAPSSSDPPSGTGSARSPPDAEDSTPNTALNALVGAVVTAATVFVLPFSPVLGGGVAGYLEGGETRDGLWVGALAGLVAMVPVVALLLLAATVVPVVGPRGVVGLLLFGGLAVVLAGAYVVGLGGVGGILGAYLKRER